MNTMCPPGYDHSGFMATHVLGHMMYIYIYNIYVYILYVYIYIFINHLAGCVFLCWYQQSVDLFSLILKKDRRCTFLLTRNGFLNHFLIKRLVICQPQIKFDAVVSLLLFHIQCVPKNNPKLVRLGLIKSRNLFEQL